MKYFAYAFAFVAYVAGALFIYTATFAEAATIETVWSVDVDQRLPNDSVALSHPAIFKYLDETWAVLAGRDGWVHVYDIVSGGEVRRFYLGVPVDSGALTLQNNTVVFGDIQGHLYAVDPVKGKVVWQKRMPSTFTMQPVAVGSDFLVQTADNELYHFSESGEKRWSYAGSKNTLSLYLAASPRVVGDVIYTVFNNGDAVALKAYTGDALWKQQTISASLAARIGDINGPLATPLLVEKLHLAGEQVDHALMVPIFNGELVILSAEDGSQSFSLPVSLKSEPLLVNNKIFMADSLGFLHAYNTKKGSRLWSKKISEHELVGPVVFGGALWLTDNQGNVFRANMDGVVEAHITLKGGIARLPIVTDMGLLIRTDRGLMTLVK